MYHIVYDETLASLRNNAPQKIRITVNTANEIFEITQSNLTQGSCSVDRYCCSGERIEIGSAIAAELKLTLKNAVIKYNGQEYNPENITFEGAEMCPFCLVPSVDGRYEEIPLGVFTVDEQPRKLSTITIKALDRMMRFDVAHDGAVGTSLLAVVQHCCDLAGVTLSSSAVTFLNGFADVYTLPEAITDKEDLTCRQVLMWVGEMTASCAYADEYGRLAFKQYPQTYLGAMTISEADRYSSDMQESDITITGITVTPTDSESEAVTIGAQGYEWNVEGNPLLTIPDEMANAPLGYADGAFFTYRPFTANTKSFPHLWPMDAIVFSKRNSDGESIAYNSVITHHTWKLNGGSAISAVGKTATKNGYATYGGFTAKQKAILERSVKSQVKTQVSGYQQAILDINEVAQRATGLYNTTDKDTGIIYYHNQPDIADSTYIYMESTSGRFMATGANAWNDGSPVWTNAWTSMGQLVVNSLAAGSITTDMLNIGGAANPVYNLMTAGDFVDPNGGIGWVKASDDGGANNAPQSAATETSATDGVYPVVGKECMRILVGTATGAYPNIINKYNVPVVAGTYYTASYYFCRQRAKDTRWCRLVIDWLDSSGTKKSTSTIKATDYDTQWHRYSAKLKCPDGATQAKIRFYVESNVDYIEGTTVKYNDCYTWLCGVMLSEGETLYDWDDGIHPNGSNVIIDRTGIDIYNGAFNLYAPNGQNVIHFDADNSLNIDVINSASLTITNDFGTLTDTGKARMLIKSPTESLSYNVDSLNAAQFVYQFNSMFPHIETSFYDVSGDGVLPASTTWLNPMGIHVSGENNSYFSELNSSVLHVSQTNDDGTITYTSVVAGGVFTRTVNASSSESIKTNINKAESMLDKILNAGIYSYNYISDTESSSESSGSSGGIVEEGSDLELTTAPTHYGLVIGEGYSTPSEVISEDGAHIDLYSMVSLAWKAIQELAGIVNGLTATEVT